MSISTTSGWCSATALRDLAAVGGLADDLDVVGAGEQHREPGADERVVVDDQHADPLAHCGHGSQARSRKSPCSSSPCSRRPPESVARSARPTRPGARAGDLRCAGGEHRRRVAHLDREPVARGAPSRRSSTGADVACLRAFVSASWTIRSAWRPTASGTAARSATRDVGVQAHARRRATPRAAPGSAASVGWGGCGVCAVGRRRAARRSRRAGPRAPGARWRGSPRRRARPPRAARPGGTRARRRAG